MSNKPRKIVHVDCDSFYASIEMRDNPALQRLPVAVGGAPERRGVVATCNYLARQHGIHSAMASATARKLCPGLVIVKPDMTRYRAASKSIHEIFRHYTTIIEPLSLDEAYLDLSDSGLHGGDPTLIATEIRARIEQHVGITVSAGIAGNKFLAKIASDWNKPNGQFTIEPSQVDRFVHELPVRKLFGVGRVTAAKMQKLGIATCGDLRKLDSDQLEQFFGRFGKRLYELCRGIDMRPVQPRRIRKSISVENTFATDLPDLVACRAELPALHAQLLKRINHVSTEIEITKQVVKIKFHDFVSTTVETLSDNADLMRYGQLLEEGFGRGRRPVRLLGIGVRLASSRADQKHASETDCCGGPATEHLKGQLALFRE